MTDPQQQKSPKSMLQKLFEELALVLTPSALIALFSQLLDVSNKDTAAISLVVALAAALCIHRTLINQFIPSVWPTTLVLALGAVFYFQYDEILLKDTGLLRWYRQSSDVHQEIGKGIEASKAEIWILATNLHISIEDRKGQLLDKLTNEGIHINILVLDPAGDYLGQVARDFGGDSNKLMSECLDSLRSLIELDFKWQELKQHAKKPGDLQIKLFNGSPKGRLYVFDPHSEHGITIFNPYINKMNPPALPAYILANQPTGAFAYYFNGIVKQWTDSVTLDQWRTSHQELLNLKKM